MKLTLATFAVSIVLLTACNQPKTENAEGTASDTTAKAAPAESKQERNKKIAMASMDGIKNHDANMVTKDAAADFKDYGDGSMPAMPLDSAKKMIGMWLGAFDVKGEDLKYFADGDYVLIYGDWTQTWKGDMMGMKATGKTVKNKEVDILKFNDDGKIIEHRNIYPSAYMMQQMGAKMPAEKK